MKKSKLFFKGKLISLSTRKVRLPNGYIANLEIIEHPGAALVVPFLTNNKIVILKQFRPVINDYMYELPAGTLKVGESPLYCAAREIVEETGFSAKKFKKLGFIYPVPGYSTEKITIFKAEVLTKEKSCMDKDEIIECMIVNKNKIKNLFKNGMIIDAKSICALAMCGWL